jgi:hypothetical protein
MQPPENRRVNVTSYTDFPPRQQCLSTPNPSNPRKSAPLRRSAGNGTIPPLSVAAAASALLAAFKHRFGLDQIDRIVIGRTTVSAAFGNGSTEFLAEAWRTEQQARLGAIPGGVSAGPAESPRRVEVESALNGGKEHPEQTFRRGYHAGAAAVVGALEAAGVLDRRTTIELADFVFRVIPEWRRHPEWNAPPRLTIDKLPPNPFEEYGDFSACEPPPPGTPGS